MKIISGGENQEFSSQQVCLHSEIILRKAANKKRRNIQRPSDHKRHKPYKRQNGLDRSFRPIKNYLGNDVCSGLSETETGSRDEHD